MTKTSKLLTLAFANLILAAFAMPAHAQTIELPPIVIVAKAKPAARCVVRPLEQGGRPDASNVKVCQ